MVAPAPSSISAVQPDHDRANRVARSFDRVIGVRLAFEAGSLVGQVFGVRHRRPVRVTVDGATALGLQQRGYRTVGPVGP